MAWTGLQDTLISFVYTPQPEGPAGPSLAEGRLNLGYPRKVRRKSKTVFDQLGLTE